MVSNGWKKKPEGTGKKMENYIPIIYLVDSAGVYLPMQDEIFPDKEHLGGFSETTR